MLVIPQRLILSQIILISELPTRWPSVNDLPNSSMHDKIVNLGTKFSGQLTCHCLELEGLSTDD